MKIGLLLGCILSAGILALLANSPAQVPGGNGSVSLSSVTLSLPAVAVLHSRRSSRT